MDRRLKPRDPAVDLVLRQLFFARLSAGELSFGEAVAAMRRITRLTQVEFAQRTGVALNVIKQIETGRGNPNAQTLAKLGAVLGLQVGFVPARQLKQITGAVEPE